ncbi:histidine phosphatase superfamily [Halteromyces radiatus]|uniref:histidine phosphatase superfamily n=1 Tax=Halteromyces radiatus TaxID=101107 RepID=UPI0022211F27|nr:histidine phosphatase superfamily [Halteromyces radiatus]KAI8096975.1 histidine phosphatase superfamily [Halteromyces radiatus]
MAPVSPTIDTVFIVRHGERIDHCSETWQPDPSHGITDPPLSLLGHRQAEKTGQHLGYKIQQNTIQQPIFMIYTSPFQRCIDTSIGIIKGLQSYIDPLYPPILRLDLGLGEWMSDQFYDDISCSGSQFLARHQEQLARRQATYYRHLHMKKQHDTPPSPSYDFHDILPSLTVDYAYHSSRYSDFDFPESYKDMLHRFDQTRLDCIRQATVNLPSKYQNNPSVIVILVTHGIGVNALLDSFRNTITRPVETPYCSISSFRYHHPTGQHSTNTTHNNVDDDDDDDWLDSNSSKLKQPKWIPDLIIDASHLSNI